MAALRSRHPRGGRRWLIGLTMLVAVGALLLVAGAMGTLLPGSSFDTSNGSLTSTTNHDWNPPGKPAGNVGPVQPIACGTAFPSTGTNCALDWVNSSADNAFGQGTKEDTTTPTIVTGTIPPNKDDLTRFYINQETGSNGDQFLYLAWQRTKTLGSAHMDFELNQAAQPDMTGAGQVTLNRTAGDVLIDFDFGGSGPVVLSYHTWLATGTNASTQCEASNSFPCWSAGTPLSAGIAIASINHTNVNDYNPPVPAAGFNVLPGSTSANGTVSSTFGEAGIDLQAAGIFPKTTCEHFGDAWLKSRSSGSSFSSEMKDFIAPLPVNISNCGNVIIHKVTVPSPDPTDTTFAYTTSGGLSPATFGLKNGQTEDYGSKVPAGTYSVSETDPGPSFVLTSLDCSASSVTSGSSYSVTGGTVTFTLKPLDVIECTYTNTLQRGALLITKTSSKAAASPLAGAVFSITGPNSYSNSVTTGAAGTACVDGLAFGTYTVTETTGPPGYSIDNPNGVTVVVDHNATCSSGTPNAPAAFTDTPLTDITATATSEAVGGTKSSISCVDGNNADVGNSPQGPAEAVSVAANGLKPGTYTCTLVIDP